jgi:DNA-3-methyladenine glycosylase
MSAALAPIDPDLLLGDIVAVAPRLLNLVLVHGTSSGRIVEVEAYGGSADPASHAYRGRTKRNATMFGPPGRLYVYFTYGMHHCANVVCGGGTTASAVLLRGLTPLTGLDEMRRRRGSHVPDRLLCAGPGRLCSALGIDLGYDGMDLTSGQSAVVLCSDGLAPPAEPQVSARIGLSERTGDAVGRPWRFWVQGAEGVSRAVMRPPRMR